MPYKHVSSVYLSVVGNRASSYDFVVIKSNGCYLQFLFLIIYLPVYSVIHWQFQLDSLQLDHQIITTVQLVSEVFDDLIS